MDPLSTSHFFVSHLVVYCLTGAADSGQFLSEARGVCEKIKQLCDTRMKQRAKTYCYCCATCSFVIFNRLQPSQHDWIHLFNYSFHFVVAPRESSLANEATQKCCFLCKPKYQKEIPRARYENWENRLRRWSNRAQLNHNLVQFSLFSREDEDRFFCDTFFFILIIIRAEFIAWCFIVISVLKPFI